MRTAIHRNDQKTRSKQTMSPNANKKYINMIKIGNENAALPIITPQTHFLSFSGCQFNTTKSQTFSFGDREHCLPLKGLQFAAPRGTSHLNVRRMLLCQCLGLFVKVLGFLASTN